MVTNVVPNNRARGTFRGASWTSAVMYEAAFHPEYEYITKNMLRANGQESISLKSLGPTLKGKGCLFGSTRPAMIKKKIISSLRIVVRFWKTSPERIPVNRTPVVSQTTNKDNARGDSTGTKPSK